MFLPFRSWYRTCRTNHFTDTDKSFKDRFNQFYTVVKVFGGLNSQVTTFEKLSYNSCRSKEVFNVDAISSEWNVNNYYLSLNIFNNYLDLNLLLIKIWFFIWQNKIKEEITNSPKFTTLKDLVIIYYKMNKFLCKL
jgi:hypothetical protein